MFIVEFDDVGDRVLGLRANEESLVSKYNETLAAYDNCKKESFDLGIQGLPEAFYIQTCTRSLVFSDNESRSVSYGDVKKVETPTREERGKYILIHFRLVEV
ncbi:uncharacterized protein LOC8264222 [Ricinus communis]|uniref:uncharacterized protein LOC8264222 n=1 Tax=Ricinus communis TaxID=3988 RepID=UPI000772745F|nr:uncharacterized protein LOC8264222 [Ricinus communis]|eukprot:XP_015578412.1 uncharacterized protein LOC8264222 isoform X2 [Ricinus communis]